MADEQQQRAGREGKDDQEQQKGQGRDEVGGDGRSSEQHERAADGTSQQAEGQQEVGREKSNDDREAVLNKFAAPAVASSNEGKDLAAVAIEAAKIAQEKFAKAAEESPSEAVASTLAPVKPSSVSGSHETFAPSVLSSGPLFQSLETPAPTATATFQPVPAPSVFPVCAGEPPSGMPVTAGQPGTFLPPVQAVMPPNLQARVQAGPPTTPLSHPADLGPAPMDTS